MTGVLNVLRRLVVAALQNTVRVILALAVIGAVLGIIFVLSTTLPAGAAIYLAAVAGILTVAGFVLLTRKREG